MKLSIIIPTKDRSNILATTLSAAIEAISHADAEIIVVNDSKTNVPPVPEYHNVLLVNSPGAGVAAARNFGFKNSTGELLLFLDNDIIISRESVDHILDLHAHHPHACFNLNWEYSTQTLKRISASSFTRFLEAFQMISFKGWYDHPSWKDNALFMSKSVASFHLSISRISFEKTGGYNEEFPLAGFEDYDFPRRLKHAGVALYIDSRVTVCHNEIDRLDLHNWLINQQNRARTRKKAVALGYHDLALEYHIWKRILLHLIIRSECLFRRILKAFPNSPITDPLYFKVVAALQASRIYKGYMLADK